MKAVSHDKGVRAQNWVAQYLTTWWPHAESIGSGRRGHDIENTPGVAWEIKTAAQFRPKQFVRQACAYAGDDIPLVVYLGPRMGKITVPNAPVITPLYQLQRLLEPTGGHDDIRWMHMRADEFRPQAFAVNPPQTPGVDLTVVVYLSPGMIANRVPIHALTITPLNKLMSLLELAGYAPGRRT